MSRRNDPALAQGEADDRAARDHAGMDHRQGTRYRLVAPVRIHLRDTGTTGGYVYDISQGGMFLRCAMVPETSTCVDIEVTTPARDQNGTVHIPGLVVHCRKDGFGVIFRRLGAGARDFVMHNLR
ncbi:MAG: PilZ domain-containing protein [Gammaproteobacteria bacterium]